jgi:Domain of unknown function (DUF222)
MTGDNRGDTAAAHEAVADARREAAAALARLAGAAVRYADARITEETAAAATSGLPRIKRAKPGEFVADELAVMLRDQPYQVRCLLPRSRRLATGLPTVWEAFRRGDLDADQIRVIDRIARKVTETATVAAIDGQAVEAAQTRSPKQLSVWLLRLVVQLEPLAFAERHRRALAERRVTVVQGADGIGYVTGEASAADAAAIDATLAALARSLGAADPRTEQQRRADLFADLLLGRLAFDQPDHDPNPDNDEDAAHNLDQALAEPETEWLEVENIDPDTGELIGTRLQHLDGEGEPIGEPVDTATHHPPGAAPKPVRRPQKHRIGIVVPLASLLGLSDTQANSPSDPDSSPQQNSNSSSPTPSTRTTATRYCSPTGPPRPHLRHQQGPVLPKTPPGQNLRLASLHQRRPRRRLDHARRRNLPMPRRTTTTRTSRLTRDLSVRRSGGSPDSVHRGSDPTSVR